MKPEYYYNIEQGTEEWHQVRRGIVTASEVDKLFTAAFAIANNKTSRTYATKKAAERITSRVEFSKSSGDMMRGHLQEPIAREYYNDNYAEVEECGFITREIEGITIGASPDGLVGDNGGIEIKSRLSHFQVETILSGEVPKEYLLQIQTSLLISGREWWDFVQLSNGMELFVKRVYPDLELQDKIVEACKGFELLVEELVVEFKQKAKTLIPTEYVELNNFDDVFEVTEEEA